jgi:hypothetical protein
LASNSYKIHELCTDKENREQQKSANTSALKAMPSLQAISLESVFDISTLVVNMEEQVSDLVQKFPCMDPLTVKSILSGALLKQQVVPISKILQERNVVMDDDMMDDMESHSVPLPTSLTGTLNST